MFIGYFIIFSVIVIFKWILISEYLFLSKDVFILQNLMKDIYPFAYKHFWRDSGNFYINSQYSKENIIKELSQEKTEYYFIVFNKEIIGNLRVIWDAELKNLAIKKQVKLHRIYLHPKTHNKGLGKTILSWLETEVKNKGYRALWLDAMVEQEDSFKFYKIWSGCHCHK